MPRPRTPKAGDTQTEELYNSRTDSTLTLQAKTYRDAFVREYIKDYSGKNALIRIGCKYKGPQLHSRSSQLLREPYVANRIDELCRQLRPEDVVSRQQVMGKMWEMTNDPHIAGIARVAACSHVAKMLGMFKADEKDAEKAAEQMGVMFIPLVSMEDWQSTAATAQALLKSQARSEPVSVSYPPPPPPPMPAPQPASHGNN